MPSSFRPFRHLALPVVLAGVALTPARAQTPFEGELGMKMGGMPNEVKAYVREGKFRMDMAMSGQEMYIIMNPAAKEQYMVMPGQKMYMVMQMSDMTAMADSIARTRTTEGKLTATGKKLEIAGHSCEVYHFEGEKTTMDMCLATGLGSLAAPGSFWGGGGGMGRPAPATPAWAKSLMAKGAFPLQVSDSSGRVVWEITRIERKSLDPSLFVPPADFRKMQMPGGMRPPGMN